MVVLSSLEDHSVTVLEEPYQRYFTMLSVAELEKQTGNPRLTAVFKNRPPGFRHVLTLPGGGERLEGIFAALLAEYSRPGPFRGAVRRPHQGTADSALPGKPGGLSLLRRAAVSENRRGPAVPGIPFYRAGFGGGNRRPGLLQADYFSRSFKEITGYTPSSI